MNPQPENEKCKMKNADWAHASGPLPNPFPEGEGTRRPKIAFVSPHCLVDFTNGAATATRDGLKLLAKQGLCPSGERVKSLVAMARSSQRYETSDGAAGGDYGLVASN